MNVHKFKGSHILKHFLVPHDIFLHHWLSLHAPITHKMISLTTKN